MKRVFVSLPRDSKISEELLHEIKDCGFEIAITDYKVDAILVVPAEFRHEQDNYFEWVIDSVQMGVIINYPLDTFLYVWDKEEEECLEINRHDYGEYDSDKYWIRTTHDSDSLCNMFHDALTCSTGMLSLKDFGSNAPLNTIENSFIDAVMEKVWTPSDSFSASPAEDIKFTPTATKRNSAFINDDMEVL